MLTNLIRRVKEITFDSRLLPKIFGLNFFPRQPASIIFGKLKGHIHTQIIKLTGILISIC